MQILSRWTDDHLPCVTFEHKGTKFELCWSSDRIVSALEYADESEKARKKIAALMKKLDNPDSIENEDENEDEPNLVTAYLPEGCLMFRR